MQFRDSRETIVVLAIFTLFFGAAVLPVAVGWRVAEASFDEQRCYLPAITQMRANFPAVDILRDSLSANPPGYTHVLAGLSFLTGDTLPAHRAWHFVLSLLGALGLLWFAASLVRGTEMAVAALLPAICSGYYLKSAAQLSTDNLALVLSVAVTALALFGSSSGRTAALAGVLGALAVYIRHVTAWTAAPLFAKACVLWWQRSRADRSEKRRIVTWMLAAAAVVLPLVIFVWFWQGLVPPMWGRAHGSLSMAPLVYGLALCGVFGPVFLWAAYLSRSLDFRRADVLYGSVAGLVLFVFTETSPSYEAGRWGGPLWALAGKLPLWGDRSLLFLPFAMLGGAALAVAARSLASRMPARAFVWAFAFVAWMITGIPNRQVFHRYYEGPVLAFWGLWLIALLDSSQERSPATRAVLYGLSVLLLLSGAHSLLTSVTGFAAPISGQ